MPRLLELGPSLDLANRAIVKRVFLAARPSVPLLRRFAFCRFDLRPVGTVFSGA
ncbi:hypothetical protein B0G71_7593 [Paraburkholderia sp. BL27I4N3]|nr:hypothetical protein B0G71_7593 [Paraburkholderia sp. BL27I4N3]